MNMKRLIYSLSIVAFAVVMSCNDDNEVTRDLLLTKVIKDGVTNVELFYDLERRMTRSNVYAAGDLSLYMLYEYNEHGIAEARRYYGEDHELELKAVFALDNF